MFSLSESESLEHKIGDTTYVKNLGSPADDERSPSEPGFTIRLHVETLAAVESQEFVVSNFNEDGKPNGYGSLMLDAHQRSLEGVARLDGCKVGILGAGQWSSDIITIELILDDGTWKNVRTPNWPARPKGGYPVAIYHFDELNRGQSNHWNFCVAVPEKLFDRIYTGYAYGRLKFLEIQLKADMWCRKAAYYDGERNDLFLKPREVGAAYVMHIVYEEHAHSMRKGEQPIFPESTKTQKSKWFRSLFKIVRRFIVQVPQKKR